MILTEMEMNKIKKNKKIWKIYWNSYKENNKMKKIMKIRKIINRVIRK
jgi:hypothetical protein